MTTPAIATGELPKRFIFTPPDFEEFSKSPIRKELLSFVSALGRSCVIESPGASTPRSRRNLNDDELEGGVRSPGDSSLAYSYNPDEPLVGLSPGMASLWGSLQCMAERWIAEIPPDANAKARFGNPSFKLWYQRLEDWAAKQIIESVLRSHGEQASLEESRKAGYEAAQEQQTALPEASASATPDALVEELREYFLPSFGHHIRLDYGTGHEASFVVFLLALSKLGVFGANITPALLAPIALSVVTAYLRVTRGVQTDYMLEPAGSHGVWGLDDYHALPFYIGACQLRHNPHGLEPSSIHDAALLRDYSRTYLYFGCIAYIKELKRGVPFFEHSPMLNDISNLPSWEKVYSGLLRLYEGEVLNKRPVVQHFVFGNLIPATWTPVELPREAPKETFRSMAFEPDLVAPWAQNRRGPGPPPPPSGPGAGGGLPPPTRAPWAKE